MEQREPGNKGPQVLTTGVQLEFQSPGLGSTPNSGYRSPVWGVRVDSIFAIAGFTVNFWTVWNYPSMAFVNGGSAFMIAYFIVYSLGAMPLLYLESVLGQYSGKGVIGTWRNISPIFRGLGYAAVLLCLYNLFYLNSFTAMSFYYLFLSFSSVPPWASCDNYWNTLKCFTVSGGPASGGLSPVNFTDFGYGNYDLNYTSLYGHNSRGAMATSALEWFERRVAGLTYSSYPRNRGIVEPDELGSLGGVVWQIAGCALLVYIICFFVLWPGVRVFGKVAWVTTIFPFLALCILIVRAVTLPGGAEGILYFIYPNFSLLFNFVCWSNAWQFAMLSLSPCYGAVLTYSSYNRFKKGILVETVIVGIINPLIGNLFGVFIFAVYGFLAYQTNEFVSNMVNSGPHVAFMTLADWSSSLPAYTIWLILIYLMFICIGLGPTFGLLECVVKTMTEEIKLLRNRRWAALLIVLPFCYLIGLLCCTRGSFYVTYLLESSLAVAVPILACVECIVVTWIYGWNRLYNDMRDMFGIRPGMHWRVFWQIITPAVFGIGLLAVCRQIVAWVSLEAVWWYNLLTIIVTLSVLAAIPAVIIYDILVKGGNFNLLLTSLSHRPEDQPRTLATYNITTTTTTTATYPTAVN